MAVITSRLNISLERFYDFVLMAVSDGDFCFDTILEAHTLLHEGIRSRAPA